jgi:hypothetical protein
MSRKLPKKPQEHDNDRIARRNLEENFGNWSIARIADDSSGGECGQDWMVGIVTETGEVTGLEFRVQSKVLRSKDSLQRSFIRTKISISTLNYLFELSVPVLLHFIHLPTNQAYVMWLEDWFVPNWTDSWDNKDKVRVKIPLTSKLTKSVAHQIEVAVREKHQPRHLLKLVETINKTSTDFDISLSRLGQNSTVVVNSKHDNAIPEIAPLDDQAERTLQQALETGLDFPLSGNFGIRNFPTILFQDAEITAMYLLPDLTELPSIPLRIQYLNADQEIIHETKYVEMLPVQHGTKIKKWKGKSNSEPMVFSLEIDLADQQVTFEFSLPPGERNPLENTRFFDALRLICMANTCRLIDLRNDSPFVQTGVDYSKHFDQEMRALETLARALKVVHDRIGILIYIPPKFSGTDINLATSVAKILSDGIYPKLLKEVFPSHDFVLLFTGNKEWADAVMENSRTDKEPVTFTHPSTTVFNANLFGHQIELGTYETVFESLKFLKVNNQGIDTVEIAFTFDREKSFTRFPRWYKE